MKATVTLNHPTRRHATVRDAVIRFAATAAVAVGTTAGSVTIAAQPASADWVRNDQWQLRSLDAASAWPLSTGKGVLIAVLDSGVDATHPDLAGQVLPGADFVDGSTDGRVDPVGHGTTVAGLIAGRADDSNGVIGLAPDAKILPVRVLDAKNRYDDASEVAKGVRWAVDRGASVINLSLGGPARSEALADALNYAASRNVVVIACTGNAAAGSPSSTDVWYPAREPGVVAVAGLTATVLIPEGTDGAGTTTGGGAGGSQDPLWSGSLTGPQTVLTAPAVNLLGAKPGGYWRVQGTSFAAPLVASAAALIRSRWPQMSAANVVNRLIRTAYDLGSTGRDNRFGFGSVDPVAALRTDVPEVTANPLGRHVELDPPPRHGLDERLPVSGGGPTDAEIPGSATSLPSTAPAARSEAKPARLRLSLLVGAIVSVLLSTSLLAMYQRRLARGRRF